MCITRIVYHSYCVIHTKKTMGLCDVMVWAHATPENVEDVCLALFSYRRFAHSVNGFFNFKFAIVTHVENPDMLVATFKYSLNIIYETDVPFNDKFKRGLHMSQIFKRMDFSYAVELNELHFCVKPIPGKNIHTHGKHTQELCFIGNYEDLIHIVNCNKSANLIDKFMYSNHNTWTRARQLGKSSLDRSVYCNASSHISLLIKNDDTDLEQELQENKNICMVQFDNKQLRDNNELYLKFKEVAKQRYSSGKISDYDIDTSTGDTSNADTTTVDTSTANVVRPIHYVKKIKQVRRVRK